MLTRSVLPMEFSQVSVLDPLHVLPRMYTQPPMLDLRSFYDFVCLITNAPFEQDAREKDQLRSDSAHGLRFSLPILRWTLTPHVP